MIKEDLVAERVAIDLSRDHPDLGDKDATTKRIMEDILAW